MKPAGVALVKDGGRCWFSFSEPLREFRALRTSEVQGVLKRVESATATGHHCVGFVSYEAAPAFDSALPAKPSALPLAWFREYGRRDRVTDIPDPVGAFVLTACGAGLSKDAYRKKIQQIKTLLRAGSTYQVNLTFPMHFEFAGDPFDLFCQLQRNQQSDHSVYFDTGDLVVCSVSPELFFSKKGTCIEARPMKGTACRMPDIARDNCEERTLLASGKNAAENVMIVDMIRNDLGRISEPGSVAVTSLFDLERYPTVFQATSTVKGCTEAGLYDLFCALFPCASVTGAPKVETMKIIRELEVAPRGLYTGAIGYVSPGEMSFNVGIRTLVIEPSGSASYGAGSGVVWESDADEEYDECLAKAKVLTQKVPVFDLLETMLWEPDKGYALLDYHLERLSASARYFGFKFSRKSVGRALKAKAASLGCRSRVRLLLADSGKCRVSATPLPAGRTTWRVGLSRIRASCEDRFVYHKTTQRSFYDRVLADGDGRDDMLVFNEAGELTESCNANVVVVIEGCHYTPPVKCGLLAGTYRREMLRKNLLKERVISVGDLKRADDVYLINSVRGKIPIVLEDSTLNMA